MSNKKKISKYELYITLDEGHFCVYEKGRLVIKLFLKLC